MNDTLIKNFKKSEEMLERALKTIPLGTQTFSKSKTQYPLGVSPFYIQKAKGSRVWDVDGNEYIDFICGLGSISLGYNDQDVMNAVKAQLEEGTIFSLPHSIEIEVAEKMKEMIPCAEMVRFGKNGSDATAGAVRVSRAFTKKDYVVVCGYHGWQDWYIGSTQRNLGVPKATQDLTLKFEYNNIESLNKLFKEYPNKIACVVMEAMNFEWPEIGQNGNFLQEVKDLCHKNGALFVIDEMITGFRYANGGAQEYFGVTPDLATFGKGMANGYPISAVCGRADIMKLFEDCFFSFTFGGETLSLAASLASMKKYQTQPVVEVMKNNGQKILDAVGSMIKKNNIKDIFQIGGHPSWTILNIKDTEKYNSWTIKTLYMQEMIKRGILTIGAHETTFAHSDEDINYLIKCYDEVFPILKDGIKNGKVVEMLDCKPLVPLFKVR